MELLVILLSILKVIGFILLVVLALILVIVLLILFSPICYQLAGIYTEEIGANFDVKWILGVIHIYGDYYNKDMRFSLRLFGYCVYGFDKKQKKNKKKIYTEQDTIISARSKQEEQQDKEQQHGSGTVDCGISVSASVSVDSCVAMLLCTRVSSVIFLPDRLLTAKNIPITAIRTKAPPTPIIIADFFLGGLESAFSTGIVFVTFFPQFGQNCASSDNFAPHSLQNMILPPINDIL